MRLLRIGVSVTDYSEASALIMKWAVHADSRYLCIANVHMLMEATDSPAFRNIVNDADLVTPDGMPLVWMMRLKGARNQQRVYGPALMLHVLEAAAGADIPVGFYGGKPDVLKALVKRMQVKFPKLNAVYAFSPPFQDMNPAEDASIVNQINESGARILFVGLGCPKQEIWMAQHRSRLKVVMLGVGAAFDFHSGMLPQAPPLMQSLGLEWLFRLLTEPRRLWKRYLYHNPRFLVLAAADLLGLMKAKAC